MNHYTLAEMTPGLTEEFTVTVTAEMMDAFCAITGDVSPIHIDADYAKGRGYPGRVVYGMTEKRLLELTGSNEQNPTFSLPCREVFARGQKDIKVEGPFPEIEEEAAEVHKGYWD